MQQYGQGAEEQQVVIETSGRNSDRNQDPNSNSSAPDATPEHPPVLTIVVSKPEEATNAKGDGSKGTSPERQDKVSVIASAKKGFLPRSDSDCEECRICQQPSEEPLIDLGCGCRGELAKAHRSCIEIWFRTKGSNKCEICQQVAVNVPLLDSQPALPSYLAMKPTRFVAHNIVKEKTTADLMTALSGMYEKPSANNKIYLMKKLFNLKMTEGTPVVQSLSTLTFAKTVSPPVSTSFSSRKKPSFGSQRFPFWILGFFLRLTGSRSRRQKKTNYWVWRVGSIYGGSNIGRRGRERGCVSPLWVAFAILIGGLLLDVLVSVSLGVSALPVNIIIGVLIVLGLGTALRLALECCHEWRSRRPARGTEIDMNPGSNPIV